MSNIPKITDNWKKQFPKLETPRFYAQKADIYTYSLFKETPHKTTIEIFDSEENLVIKCFTNDFGMEIVEPNFKEITQQWTEQDFSQLTQPIIFDKNVGNIYLSNCGTENWYELTIYPVETLDDKIATIFVKVFYYSV